MNRIVQVFNDKSSKKLIAFITGGDPNLATTKELILAMAASGVDMIEIGIPFSDPGAEGPTIEKANIRGLASGTTVDHLFGMVAELRETVKIPLLFMTYANLIFAYGKERFMGNCEQAGIDGIIVPDLPLEELDEFKIPCQKHNILQIPMIAPTSHQRLEQIVAKGEGFLYCVSSLGVTGVRQTLETTIGSLIEKVAGRLPCAIGFGISTPAQARAMSQLAEGVIMGSAIVNLIETHGEGAVGPVSDFVKSVREELNRHD